VYGWSVKKNSAHVRRSVGFLSQATSCYDRLSVREMVTYFARLNGMSSIRICKRVEQVFEQFDMCDFADVRCDKLSSGMRQKVSVARSVIHDPPVMIFDEPTAGLDIIASSTVVNFVQDCRTQGKCVLLSTHNMEEVEKLCNRVGIIHKGKLLCCESIDKLRARTSTTRVEDAFLELIKGSST
jgi:sodium transport system ATP-binding protein